MPGKEVFFLRCRRSAPCRNSRSAVEVNGAVHGTTRLSTGLFKAVAHAAHIAYNNTDRPVYLQSRLIGMVIFPSNSAIEGLGMLKSFGVY